MDIHKSTPRKSQKKYVVIKKSELKQNLFHELYFLEGYQVIGNLSVTLINQLEDLGSLRKKGLYW